MLQHLKKYQSILVNGDEELNCLLRELERNNIFWGNGNRVATRDPHLLRAMEEENAVVIYLPKDRGTITLSRVSEVEYINAHRRKLGLPQFDVKRYSKSRLASFKY